MGHMYLNLNTTEKGYKKHFRELDNLRTQHLFNYLPSLNSRGKTCSGMRSLAVLYIF